MDEPLSPTGTELARLRVDIAAAERRNRTFSNESDTHDSSFLGLIIQFAERKEEVALTIAGSEPLRGRIISVGPDAIILDTVPQFGMMLVKTSAIQAVTSDGQRILSASAHKTTGALFLEKLADWTGSEITAYLLSGERLAGKLESVGTDVLTMRHALRGGISYVPAQTLAGCRLK